MQNQNTLHTLSKKKIVSKPKIHRVSLHSIQFVAMTLVKF